MKTSAYRRQTLSLFFIVSVVPALVAVAVWYHHIQPVMLLALLPALGLSVIFARLLERRLGIVTIAANKLAAGRFLEPTDLEGVAEFAQLAIALRTLSTVLERSSSETKSQGDVVASERNKLRSVLNSMTDGVFALDSAGRIILFNHAASTLTGRSIAEAAGQLAEKVIPLRENGELVMARWLAVQHGTAQQVGRWRGLELYRADGSSMYVNVQAVVLPADPNGINALITFHDVTASHELEEMKVDFVALAAHELRTPLTEVRGYLDILQHDLKHPTKDQADLLLRATSSAEQLGGLLNNLLSVARIEHGEINHQPSELDYRAFLKDLSTSLTARAKLTGRQFELKVPLKLPKLTADPVTLREVIRNLMDNALTYTADGTGRVELSVTATADAMITTVTDNGVGIPADAISHLFTKFYRVSELTNAVRGTGLGLYICRQIIETHGGSINVTSKLGEGSVFTFRLPLHVVASPDRTKDNTTITRGAHGWIKNNSLR